jgi:hypothetical protein
MLTRPVVPRTVFLGSAPTYQSPNRGLEATRVRLGCTLPGETIATFGDALSRLSGRATFLYTSGGRYWYGVQPSVARIARDRAERYLTRPVTRCTRRSAGGCANCSMTLVTSVASIRRRLPQPTFRMR